jgi:hypothetical protein
MEGGSVVDAGKQKDERENKSDGRHEHLTMRCMQTSMFQCTTARFLSFHGEGSFECCMMRFIRCFAWRKKSGITCLHHF